MLNFRRAAEQAPNGIPHTREKTGRLANDDSILAWYVLPRVKSLETRLPLLKQCFRLLRCFLHEKSHLRVRSLEIDYQPVGAQSC
jgi:hypothetical protein